MPANPPALAPEKVTTYDFTIDHTDPAYESCLTRLAYDSARYLGALGMPALARIRFAGESQNSQLPSPDISRLYINVDQEGDGYTVNAKVESSDGIVDTASFQLWQPKRSGFVVPWGIHLTSSARTIYPRLRRTTVNEKSSRVQPKVAVCGIQTTMYALFAKKYHHEVIVERLEDTEHREVSSIKH